MTDYDLFNKTLATDTRLINLIDGTGCQVRTIGRGNTRFTVEKMAAMVKETLHHTKRISQEFYRMYGRDIEQLHKGINEFLWNNYKYRMDPEFQDIRSPGCSKSARFIGVDCKGVSITASSILMNLGIPHVIRRVKKQFTNPESWSHVYIVIIHEGKEYAIDGTTDFIEQQSRSDQDDYPMSNEHRGLYKPQTKNAAQAASASRHARMLKKGSTKAVRSIGGKWLSKYRASLGNPELLNRTERDVLIFQEILRQLVARGADVQQSQKALSYLRKALESGKNPITELIGNTIYVNGVAFPLISPGLKAGFDFSSMGAGIVSGGTNNVVPTSGSSGFDFNSFLGQSGGFDLGGLLGEGGSGGNVGSTVGSVAGGVAAASFGLPPQVGSTIGAMVGNLFGGGTSFTAEKIERELAVIQNNFDQRLAAFSNSITSGNINQASLQWSKILGFSDVLLRTYQQKLSEGWNRQSSANLQTLIDTVVIIKNSLQGTVQTDLQKVFDIQPTGQTIPMGGDEDIIDFSTNGFWAAYLGDDVDIQVPLYRLIPKPMSTQTPTNNNNGNNGNSNNSQNNQGTDQPNTTPKTSSMGTNLLWLGGILGTGALATWALKDQNNKPSNKSKSK